MKPYYQDNHRTLYNKSCRDMSEIPDESIQCVVTSPPYWGLRKYSGEQDLIWGDTECEHEWVTQIRSGMSGGMNSPKLQSRGGLQNFQAFDKSEIGFCSKCGAWRGAYGLEPTPEMYVAHTVEILSEIKRVLRKDGVVFWNIGDSYYGGGHGYGNEITGKQATNKGTTDDDFREYHYKVLNRNKNMKPKDLCLIPFRVAIAAQESGWWVRSVIIWSKPNPMPESVKDRPTESHEYILMLTKSSKYYWDQESVREPHSRDWSNENGLIGMSDWASDAGRNDCNRSDKPIYNPSGRNLRSVWEFPTQPFPEAHFAVFPEKLPELCIKAATPEYGCCSKCGTPYERIIENTPMKIRRTDWNEKAGNRTGCAGTMLEPNTSRTTGWQPGCNCNADKSSSIVLDPFAGAGTTLKVAAELNRMAIGYELSDEYCRLIQDRNRQQVLV